MNSKMVCTKCGGRTFLDRIFSDNKNYETYCILCGERKFVQKSSEYGEWLSKMERQRQSLDAL